MARSKRPNPSQSDDEDEQELSNNNDGNRGISFSQQAPEASQDIAPVKKSEQENLDKLSPQERERVLSNLSRLVLFKALAGDPIDRLKCCKEAGISNDQGRILSAAFAEVAERLQNVFGFELKRIPKWMEDMKSIPNKYKDRHYVTQNGNFGSEAKAMYSVHDNKAIDKGFLMVVLGLTFCKGDQRPDGSRWILDADLYRLLNALDENIPMDPPKQSTKRNGGNIRRPVGTGGVGGVGMTPEADRLLEQYVKMDYLIKEKIPDEKLAELANTDVDETNVMYALGPRTAVDIGRKQIIYFCSDVLNEEPDPMMLAELERAEALEEEMETIEE